MSTLFCTFVAALGEEATRRCIIDVNEKCARLREADAEANARLREADAEAKLRPVALKARLLSLLPATAGTAAAECSWELHRLVRRQDLRERAVVLGRAGNKPLLAGHANVFSLGQGPHKRADVCDLEKNNTASSGTWLPGAGTLECSITGSAIYPCHPRP